MKKIAIIGNFGDLSKNATDGQTIKTRIVTQELKTVFGEKNIKIYNTYGGANNLFKAPFVSLLALLCASNVLIFPAHRGLRVYAPLLVLFSLFIPNRRLHYSVIGGWLPSFLKNKKILALSLKRFYGIYAETNTMKDALERIGFTNIFVVPNCKSLRIIRDNDLNYDFQKPFKLCTFSRINKEKGIGEAVKVIKNINSKLGDIIYSLDIYGSIEQAQNDWFEELQKSFPEYIKYKGCVEFDKSIETLKKYFILLFPTHYYTEGIPGTIIDAYAAGVPVVSAKWQSYADIIDNGQTGLCYEFDNIKEFERILINIAHNPALIISLKQNCIKRAESYLPENAMKILLENLL